MGQAQLQMSIFKAVHAAYADAGSLPLTNQELYDQVSRSVGCGPEEFRRSKPDGTSSADDSPLTRTARWTQQTMRARNWLERVPGRRGVWRLTGEGKHRFHTSQQGQVIIGFSTRLGVALVGDCRDAFANLGEPIHLNLCSPPYPLAKQRHYQGAGPETWVDFICSCIEPIVRWLAPGGSICLNVDTFEKGSPARTLLQERLIIALHERFGLSLMDRLIWHVSNKAPAPIQWASIRRVQLNVAYETVIWVTNDPMKVMSDNRRVLQPHSEKHQRLMQRGGETRTASYADGSHRVRPGSYGRITDGSIPRNVISISNTCASQRAYKARAQEIGLPAHGAPFPVELARFLIKFLTEEGQLVVDHNAGSITSGLAAEELGRRWYAGELHAEYVRGGATRFDAADVWINPELDALFARHQAQGELF